MKLYYSKEFVEANKKDLEKLFPGTEIVPILTIQDDRYWKRVDKKMEELSRRYGHVNKNK